MRFNGKKKSHWKFPYGAQLIHKTIPYLSCVWRNSNRKNNGSMRSADAGKSCFTIHGHRVIFNLRKFCSSLSPASERAFKQGSLCTPSYRVPLDKSHNLPWKGRGEIFEFPHYKKNSPCDNDSNDHKIA